MSELWREWLYPLGFLSAIAFSGRMLLQWLTSEVKGQSVVMPAFWMLSLCGNLLLAVHALIQIQFHVCLIQTWNGIISWRNLNLMKPAPQQLPRGRTIVILGLAPVIVFALFWLQGHFLIGSHHVWFRIPSAPWQENNGLEVGLGWHLFGFLGLTLFSSRFWIQWWLAEKHKASYLGAAFWWVSLAGEVICLTYFLRINDPVNFIGPAFGLIPYIRNLMLLYKVQLKQSEG